MGCHQRAHFPYFDQTFDRTLLPDSDFLKQHETLRADFVFFRWCWSKASVLATEDLGVLLVDRAFRAFDTPGARGSPTPGVGY